MLVKTPITAATEGVHSQYTRTRKPFRETRLGALLATKAPKILGVVGDLLPENGTLGVVKNLIESLTPQEIKPADKELLLKELDLEHQAYIAQLQDVQNARAREIALHQTGSRGDWLTRNLTSVLAISILLLSFVFFYLLAFSHLLDRIGENVAMFLAGSITSIATTVVTYYFGSSRSSDHKQTTLDNLIQTRNNG